MPPPEPREFPWWLAAVGAIGAVLLALIVADPVYRSILALLAQGIRVTIFVTLVAFALAAALGLLLAVCAALAPRRPAPCGALLRRGHARRPDPRPPALCRLRRRAGRSSPAVNALAEPLGLGRIQTRDFSLMWRAIIALALAYAAFIAEVFRAGLLSVDKGQIEAAEALGLNGWQRFRLVVFPQAIRTILPPLGNDFVALVKDSSLVSILGVADITQLGKVYAASSFRFFETYNVVAFLYLTMTLGLSLGLRALERRLRRREG